MRDYLKWHEAYDDPNSDLSWRLNQAQTYIRQALDHLSGPVAVLSLCAGEVAMCCRCWPTVTTAPRFNHPDRTTPCVGATGAGICCRGRADRGDRAEPRRRKTAAYVGSAPADLVIMMGIFGKYQ
jgi:hypothetical protein